MQGGRWLLLALAVIACGLLAALLMQDEAAVPETETASPAPATGDGPVQVAPFTPVLTTRFERDELRGERIGVYVAWVRVRTPPSPDGVRIAPSVRHDLPKTLASVPPADWSRIEAGVRRRVVAKIGEGDERTRDHVYLSLLVDGNQKPSVLEAPVTVLGGFGAIRRGLVRHVRIEDFHVLEDVVEFRMPWREPRKVATVLVFSNDDLVVSTDRDLRVCYQAYFRNDSIQIFAVLPGSVEVGRVLGGQTRLVTAFDIEEGVTRIVEAGAPAGFRGAQTRLADAPARR
ncbi:MAG: hypothetical protein CMJ83_03245 [Planctomycetes bacterium]|nr:hypothetical protein [Planctomycetota bacterium]